jgi:NitT/TauT family transport system ATP-binding protein
MPDGKGASRAAEPLVAVEDVSIWYASEREPVLSHVTLRADAGEFICLIGPSGCGKSTLLKAVAGFTPIGRGTIRVRGAEVKAPGSDRGMVFQEFALFPWLTVEQNVLFGDKAAAGTGLERKQRATHYLDLVGLTRFRDYHPSRLSGGMKQRVALARAWANQPAVLLMDEPFGALDARTRQELQDTLLRIFDEERTLCFFVTHDTSEAVYLADRVIVMHGRGVTREELRIDIPRPRDRHSEVVRRYVRDVDRLAWDAK